MRKEGYRLGLLGGTFSPPTVVGHLETAIACLRQEAVDAVCFMPVFVHTEKTNIGVSYEDRLMMVRLMLSILPSEFAGRMFVSTLEAFLPTPNKTYLTMDILAQQTGLEVKLIVGGDNATLLGWHNRQDILGRGVIAVPRGGVRLYQAELPEGVLLLDVPAIEGSSGQARARVGDFAALAAMTGTPVARYIIDNRLYG